MDMIYSWHDLVNIDGKIMNGQVWSKACFAHSDRSSKNANSSKIEWQTPCDVMPHWSNEFIMMCSGNSLQISPSYSMQRE